MKKKVLYPLFIVLLLLLSAVLLYSCVYGTNDFYYPGNKVSERVDYIHSLQDFEKKINAESLPDKYNVLVLTDTHFGSKTKTTETASFYKWLRELPRDENFPKFCLILGDNVDHGYKEQYKTFCTFVDVIEDEGIPVVSVIGNHDLYNCGWKYFNKMCYPYCSSFHFETKAFSWYCIDTGTGDVGQKQFDIINKTFEKDKKPKIVISHYPLTNAKKMGSISFHDSTERNLLIDLYGKNNVKFLLCGHLHMIVSRNFGVFEEFGNPSFCYSDTDRWTMYQIDESDINNPTVKKLAAKL